MAPLLSWVLGLCFLSSCGGLSVKIDNDREVGQTLGSSIFQANRLIGAMSHRNNGDVDSIQRAMAQELGGAEEVLASPKVTEVITAANSMAQRSNVPEDRLCPRNWSHSCPDGWELSSSFRCLAPASYEGGCAKSQDFSRASVAAKAVFAADCNAPWPCNGKSKCLRGFDYESCPLGWESIVSGLCRRVAHVDSECPDVLNLVDMGVEQKQEISSVCGVDWKCKASCERDLGASCPVGWGEKAGICVAPASYAGTCPYSVDATEMSDREKESFALACDVEFPCLENGADKQRKAVDSVATRSISGPIQPGSGKTIVPKKEDAGVTSERDQHHGLQALRGRFEVPSGPIDDHGDIRF